MENKQVAEIEIQKIIKLAENKLANSGDIEYALKLAREYNLPWLELSLQGSIKAGGGSIYDLVTPEDLSHYSPNLNNNLSLNGKLQSYFEDPINKFNENIKDKIFNGEIVTPEELIAYKDNLFSAEEAAKNEQLIREINERRQYIYKYAERDAKGEFSESINRELQKCNLVEHQLLENKKAKEVISNILNNPENRKQGKSDNEILIDKHSDILNLINSDLHASRSSPLSLDEKLNISPQLAQDQSTKTHPTLSPQPKQPFEELANIVKGSLKEVRGLMDRLNVQIDKIVSKAPTDQTKGFSQKTEINNADNATFSNSPATALTEEVAKEKIKTLMEENKALKEELQKHRDVGKKNGVEGKLLETTDQKSTPNRPASPKGPHIT